MTRRNFLFTIFGIGAIVKAVKPEEDLVWKSNWNTGEMWQVEYTAPVYDSGIRTASIRTYKEILTNEQMQVLNSYPIWEFK